MEAGSSRNVEHLISSEGVRMRLRAYLITGELVAEMMRTGSRTISVTSDIPETARFVTAEWDDDGQQFICVFQDDSFEEWQGGDIVPVGECPILRSIEHTQNYSLN